MPDGVAYQVTRILEQNMLSGTGTGAYFGRPAAGKTGTTDDHTDAWFVGYTPQLATAVWVGYPSATIEMTNVHGICRLRRQLPGDDLEPVHVARARERPGAGLDAAEGTGRLAAVERPVPVPRRHVLTETETTAETETETGTETAPPISEEPAAPEPTAPPPPDTVTVPAEPPPAATEPTPPTELPPGSTEPPPPPP